MTHTPLRKQILGAVGGMAIAAMAYFAIGQISLMRIQGSLVGGTSSSATSSVSVASTISSRQSAITPTTDPVTTPNIPQDVSRYDRIRLRTERLAEIAKQGHGGAPLYDDSQHKGTLPPDPQPVIVKEVKVPVPVEPQVIVKEVKVPVPTTPKVIIKEVPGPTRTITREVPGPVRTVVVREQTHLPDSGLTLNLIVTMSLMLTFLRYRQDLQSKVVAYVQSLRS